MLVQILLKIIIIKIVNNIFANKTLASNTNNSIILIIMITINIFVCNNVMEFLIHSKLTMKKLKFAIQNHLLVLLLHIKIIIQNIHINYRKSLHQNNVLKNVIF